MKIETTKFVPWLSRRQPHPAEPVSDRASEQGDEQQRDRAVEGNERHLPGRIRHLQGDPPDDDHLHPHTEPPERVAAQQASIAREGERRQCPAHDGGFFIFRHG